MIDDGSNNNFCTGLVDHWVVYLLRCSDGSLYCGITKDVAKRLKKHANGKASKYTRARLPVEIYWTSPVSYDKSGALREEIRIKKLPKHKKEQLR